MTPSKILVIDPHDDAYTKIASVLSPMGFPCSRVKDETDLGSRRTSHRPGLIIMVSTTRSVVDTVRDINAIQKHNGNIPLVLITRHGGESMAVAAFRAGVADYFRGAFSCSALLDSVKKYLHAPAMTLPGNASVDIGTPGGIQGVAYARMVGDGHVMRDIKKHILKFAAMECTVLITGETGTGKELAAEMIHQQSPRRKKGIVCLNCAALPETLVESELFGYRKGAFTGAVAASKGKFELASGGTLFLDEIGDMSLTAQAKILRTVENKRVYPLNSGSAVDLDVRVIAATNQDPEEMVAAGKFREDLYYRLNVARVHLPPLRQRKEDIPQLVAQSLRRLNKRFHREVSHVTAEAMSSFYLYDWPGNIRELNNMLEIAYVNCDAKKIEFSDLPPLFTKKLRFEHHSNASDRDKLLAALSATRWNKSKAAKQLKWSRMKVYRTLQRYNLQG